MNKQSIILTILCFLAISGSAQRKIQQLDEEEAQKQEQLKAYERVNKGFDPEKLVYGGNIGVSINTASTFVLAQPMIGYKVLPKTILGTGFTYVYQNYNFSGVKFSTNAYGPMIFARQHLIPQIFLHTEWHPINFERYYTYNKSERIWSNQYFVGGGYGSDGAQVYILYNLLYNENTSFYNSSPWLVRIGFLF